MKDPIGVFANLESAWKWRRNI